MEDRGGKRLMEIALFGNPNTGKTSLFNSLTGSYQYIGNWSGVTVEKKVGVFKQKKGRLIDLPGVYTLNPLSKDEAVVTQFVLYDSFDKILNIIDASQLERNLHLTLQLLELGKPVVVGLNMIDVAKNRGIDICTERLGALLGTPISSVVARSGIGCDLLADVVTSPSLVISDKNLIDYGQEIEETILQMSQYLESKTHLSSRWLTLQLLEGNDYVKNYLYDLVGKENIVRISKKVNQIILQNTGVTVDTYIYQTRRKLITTITEKVTEKRYEAKAPLSEKMDALVTNKWLGIPIFLCIMYVMFMLTFDWLGFPLSDLLDGLITGPFTNIIEGILELVGASAFIHAIVIDGIIAGVGGVLVFVPQIFILFFFISLLEDSGYMARVALVMDRTMELVGLNGKAFIPMMIGFGCNVPGVMAARTIETTKERVLTILLIPLMSCSARLPVYALFVGAFFVKHKALIVLSLYVLGIIVALIIAKIFSKTLLKGETTLFIIELPPYRLPQFQTLWRSTWDKGKGFIRKAGTFIFAGAVLIWLLSYAGPSGVNVDMDDSFLAMIGGLFSPIFTPIGFGSWQAGASLLTGFLAKEAIISTMNIIYLVPDGSSLQGLLANYYSPLAAYSFMVFILLYIPCLATVATIRKETASRKWTFISIVYAFSIAYILCFLIYQGGKLLGFS
jgi:ferrous iron transport protein B